MNADLRKAARNHGDETMRRERTGEVRQESAEKTGEAGVGTPPRCPNDYSVEVGV